MNKLSAVAVAMCLCVGSTFAAWDYFPPKEAGKGEAKLGFAYGINDAGFSGKQKDVSTGELSIAGRYSIIEGLEAAVTVPVPLMLSVKDCDNCGEKYAGLSYPEIGVRYWLPMGLGFFADFALPVDTREDSKYWVAMKLDVGAQFSTKFTEELSLGSQLGLTVPFANSETKRAEGMGLGIGVELDYSLGMVTPFLGADVSFGLTKPTYDGKEITGSEAAKAAFDITVGASAAFSEMIGADLSVKFGISDDYKTMSYDLSKPLEPPKEESFIPITIGAHVSFNF
jgi:hypothetical protein